MKQLILFPSVICFGSSLLAQSKTPSDADAAAAAASASVCGVGCCGSVAFMVTFVIAMIALNIALLVWVARDAKARGLDNAVMWMILVMFTSVLGLIIYIFARPQGALIQCPNCNNKRLQASAKCPHCGNP
jgi:uncharacterized membrane protein YhaH (DUF805 family)